MTKLWIKWTQSRNLKSLRLLQQLVPADSMNVILLVTWTEMKRVMWLQENQIKKAMSSWTNKVDQLTREAILQIRKLVTSLITSMAQRCSRKKKLTRKEKSQHHLTLRSIISILIWPEETSTTTETANLSSRRTRTDNSLTREEVLSAVVATGSMRTVIWLIIKVDRNSAQLRWQRMVIFRNYSITMEEGLTLLKQ